MTEAVSLDPTCLRCTGPMRVTVSGCPLLPRRFLAECPTCGRTVAVTLTARVLRAGRGCTESPPPKKRAGASRHEDARPLSPQFPKLTKLGATHEMR